jgi:hypothetical protein
MGSSEAPREGEWQVGGEVALIKGWLDAIYQKHWTSTT